MDPRPSKSRFCARKSTICPFNNLHEINNSQNPFYFDNPEHQGTKKPGHHISFENEDRLSETISIFGSVSSSYGIYKDLCNF